MPIQTRQMFSPQTEAARYQLELAQALQQRAMTPNVPPSGGPVQAQYGMGQGLADLANALASSWNVRNANKAYTRAQEVEKAQALEAQQAAWAQMVGGQNGSDGVGPPSPAPSYEQTIAMAPTAANAGVNPELIRALMESRKPKALERMDLGDRVEMVDQYGRPVRTVQKGATPDAMMREQGDMARWGTPSANTQMTVGATMRGQDIGAQTAQRGQDMTFAAARRGQDMTADTARARTDAQNAKVATATTERNRQAIDKVNAVMPYIDRALGATSGGTAGIIGAGMKMVPGSNAFDLGETLETIKARIGFDELQAMRQASPTGGALGQVAVQELYALQASLGSLNQRQSPAQLQQNLQAIRQHFEKWKQTVEQSQAGQQSSPTVPSSIDALMQQYGGR